MTSPNAARTALKVFGGIALVAGARAVLVGAREVPTPGDISASVDSEYRFYAAWYPILGLVLLRESTRPTVDRRVVRVLAGGLGLAAVGRALSIRALGRPPRSQIALLAIEAILAAAIPPWFDHALPREIDRRG